MKDDEQERHRIKEGTPWNAAAPKSAGPHDREDGPAASRWEDRRMQGPQASPKTIWIVLGLVAAATLVTIGIVAVGILLMSSQANPHAVDNPRFFVDGHQPGRIVQAPELPPPVGPDLQPKANFFVADASCISLTHDRTRLAIGSYDKTIRVFDVPTRTEIAVLAGHDESVHSVAVSSDGKVLASTGRDRVLNIWDVAKKERIHSIKAKQERPVVRFLPNGKVLAIAGLEDNGVHLLDVQTRKIVDHLKHDRWVTAMDITPDGKLLAMANAGIRVWDLLARKERLATSAADGQQAVVLSADGKTLAATDGDKIVILDVETGQVRKTIAQKNTVRSLGITPDATLLVSGVVQEGTRRFWKMSTGQEIASMRSIGAFLIASDGKTLYGAHDRNWVHAWDLSELPGR